MSLVFLMAVVLAVTLAAVIAIVVSRRGLPRVNRLHPQQIAAAGPQSFDAQFWRPGTRAVQAGFGRLTVVGDLLTFRPDDAGGAPFTVHASEVHARPLEGGAGGALWLWTPETGDLHGVLSYDYIDRLGRATGADPRERLATAEFLEVVRALGGRI